MGALPSFNDRPFGVAIDGITHVLELPLPPSTNRLWAYGASRVFKSAAYKQWLDDADHAMMVDRIGRGAIDQIPGHFEAFITVWPKCRGKSDLDNYIKSLLDYCQSREFITNDRNLERIEARWSTTPARGARVMLREWV